MEDLTPIQIHITRRNIISNIATLFTGSAIAQLFATITFILTARILGPQQYGQYTASMTLAMLCSILFSLGLNLWILQRGGQNPGKIGNLAGSVLTLKVSLSFVFLVITIAIAHSAKVQSLPIDLVILSALIVLFNNLFMTGLAAFKAILWNKFNAIIEAVLAIALLFFTLILIYQNVSQVSTYMMMRVVIQSIGFLCVIGLIWYFLKIKPTWKTIRRALTESPPFAASEFLAWLYMRVDVLIIAFYLNDYAVGLYAPATGIITAMYILPTSINFVFVPVLSNLFSTNVTQAWQTAKRLLGLLSVVGIVLFVLTYFGARYLILLLGSSFSESQDILQILSLILFIHSLSFGLAAILVANNRQKQRSIIQAITVAFNIGLNILVIKWMGIYGVAYVYVATEIILLIGYTFLVIRFRKIEMSQITQVGSQAG